MRTKISFLDFKARFNSYTIISVADISRVFPAMHRRRLHEWVARGLLQRVAKGFYVFSETTINESLLYSISNRIYNPSYISLHSALSWYGIIPEFVPQITAVSTKKTTTLNTPIGNFAYYSIKKSLMFGYDVVQSTDQKFFLKMAFPEKALLDFLYLNPSIKTREDFIELRLNYDTFREKIDTVKLNQYLGLFSSKTLTKRVTSLLEYLKNA